MLGADSRKAFVHGIPGHVGEGERYFLKTFARGAGAGARTREVLPPLYIRLSDRWDRLSCVQDRLIRKKAVPLFRKSYHFSAATADTGKSRTTFQKVVPLFCRYS